MRDDFGGFDEAGLLAEARSNAGLDEFGDDSFRRPLVVLLDALAAAPLSELGATILRRSLLRSLTGRLRMRYWLARHPEIASESIEAPLVVVGMMRSGTTLVHRLLAADPRHYCTLGWEAREPMPRLDTDWQLPDPRIADAEASDAMAGRFAAELMTIHPTNAHHAEEEIVFLADAFLSHVPEAYCDVPVYRSWIDDQDFEPAYLHLFRTLQVLQWQKRMRGERRGRWVLKTPAHLGYLETLLDTFPDAHVICMHRSPLDAVPSGARLNATLWRMHQNAVDPARVGRQWIERTSWAVQRFMKSRRSISGDRFTDIWYRDAVEDPLAQVERVYAAARCPLTDEAARSMSSWLDASRDQHRAPAYRAEDYGLSGGEIRERFAGYIDAYVAPHLGR